MGHDEMPCVVVFEGNEHRSPSSKHTHEPSSALCTALIAECHRAVVLEISCLKSEAILPVHFQDPRNWLLDSSSQALATALPRSFLQQALHYLSLLVDPLAYPFFPRLTTEAPSSVPTFLASSTGLLAAVAAASSSTIPEYISRVVNCFRLAFWIGYRIELGNMVNHDLSSSVVEGLTQSRLAAIVETFNQAHDDHVVLIAILSETSVVVAGRIQGLEVFSSFLLDSSRCRVNTTPFHIPQLHLGATHSVKEDVLSDCLRREILFPTLDDLRAPLYITQDSENGGGSLLDQVLDHLLCVPLDWNAGLGRTMDSIQGVDPVHIVGIGPGTKLTCRLERALSLRQIIPVIHTLPQVDISRSIADEKIAIVGMALRMPGATNPDQLWQLIENGSSSLMTVPSNRFHAADYRGRKIPRRSLEVDTGNFVADMEDFDNELFKISPREARMMDPQQRLLLHVAHEALGDAGYIRHASFASDPDHVGVFIGAATNDYVHNVRDEIDIHYVSGTLPAFLSGRISYALSLGGPSVVFDTACSSSGTAIHGAVRALRNGDCRMALAGGVNAVTCPDLFIGLDIARFLSRSGQSAPFDSDADGYTRGEGCGIFVLKCMHDALLDNDRILGVIRGVEINQSYGNSSITRTHSPTQALLLRQLLHRTQIQPGDVDVVEAHAAGTKQGDSAELLAIRDVFLSGDCRYTPLHVSSIKASIGHLEAASGAASLAKVLLMLRHSTIPRQIGIRTLNPVAADVPRDQLSISTEAVHWPQKDGATPRRAVINNYGAAGSNVSILLEEYVDVRTHLGPDHVSDVVFGMSAPNKEVLEEMRARYLAWLREPSCQATLLDVCYTSTARRQQHEYRLAFSIPSNDQSELMNRLAVSPVLKVGSNDETKAIFVYPGHGSQYPGMGTILYDTCPIFKVHIDACDAIVTDHGFPTFLPYLLGNSGKLAEEASVIEQTALFSFEIALTMLWKSWGLSPSAVIGHSLGEYASLVAAGILSLKDALLLVGGRARLVQKHCVPGYSGMLSVSLTLDALKNILRSDLSFAGLVVACANSRDRHTVAGPLSELQAFKTRLQETYDSQSTMLPAAFAYHSPAMLPILGEFQKLMKDIIFTKPSLPCASTVTGTIISSSADMIGSGHLLRHCQDLVRFAEATESLEKFVKTPGINVCWVEISPRRTLLPLVRSICPKDPSALFLDSMLHQFCPWKTLADSLSHLYMVRVDLRWKRVFSSFGQPRCISLPPYPFQSRSFWVQYRDPSLPNIDAPSASVLADPAISSHISFIQYPSRENGEQAVLSLSGSHISTYSRAHVVASVPICPASIYLEGILTGVSMVGAHLHQLGNPNYLAIHQVEFIKPLSLGELDPTATMAISRSGHLSYEFLFQSYDTGVGPGSSSVAHSRGRCEMRDDGGLPDRFQHGLSFIQERIQALDPGVNGRVDVFSSKSIYDVVFSRIVQYAKFLRSLERMVIAEDHQEGYVTMQLTAYTRESRSAAVNPVYLDAMVHFAGFIINLQGGPDDLFVCVGIGSLEILPASFSATDGLYPTYQLYTTISSLTQDSFLAETVVLSLDSSTIVARLKNINFKRIALQAFAPHVSASTTRLAQTIPISPRRPVSQNNAPIFTSPVADAHPTPLRVILEDSLHIPRGRVRGNSMLDSLGLDSLTSIEVLHSLRNKYGVALPSGFLQDHLTVREVELALEQLLSPSNPSVGLFEDCIEQLRATNSKKTPVCFIHDGTGLVSSYQKLLGIGRDVWAIKNPRMHGGFWMSVEHMASFYADSVSKHFSGDVILAGWSFGGVVAYELGKQLQCRGRPAKGLILLDAPPPSGQVILSDELINYIVEGGGGNLSPATRDILQQQFRNHVRLMSQYRGSKCEVHSPCVFIRCADGFSTAVGLDVHEWFSKRDDDDPERTTLEWKALVGDQLKVIDVPGHHFDMFRSCRVERTSDAVGEACEHVEDSGF